ncbi:pyridoxal-phosphate dependent enzyme [Spiractinospora alimapuensis]|uniref:1-aminocyclopropane-1-carboxylate deaminase/D-cysteine desulfhydrase n=1 Tax=Spiractinospora alimapuensis TaxID=2820884 RepID=UPI001F214593|nr:pyridoxal-phosphate dependent enzyme [Spiractinospora alimapuensis]QVQ51098.1 pyridoxal-phosphate dependent enzyme [Spiractinospora alimapuensis]
MRTATGAEFPVRVPSPLHEVVDERLTRRGVRLLLKREDLINPEIPGNKWRKLHPNLTAARAAGQDTLLTFGGAYSNHVRAVAAAGHHFDFGTIGVIRGEEHHPLNPSLSSAVAHGMRLAYMDRTTYRRKHQPDVVARLREEHGDFFLIPEGGSNAAAVHGCADVAREITEPVDVVCCPVGTGATLAGIAAGLPPDVRALGFPVLKGGEHLATEVRRLQSEAGLETDNWHLEPDFHFGGYAKRPAELEAFIQDFHTRHGLRLDFVYTAKTMAGLFTLAADGRIPAGSRVVAVVTG